MSMNTTYVPDAAVVLDDLRPLIVILHKALEVGTQSTLEFFDAMDKPVDANLAPCLVRYYAKDFLDSAGHHVENDGSDDGVDYERQTLANNGLLLVHGRYHIRILKSERGGLPRPGLSKARQAFYAQLPLGLSLAEADNSQPSRLNIVALWHVDSAHTLSYLSVACPKAVRDGGQDSVELHWHERVPHPAESFVNNTAVHGDTDEVEDLDVSLSYPDEGRTETAG